MDVECHDDCNIVANKPAAKELWMLCLDHVNGSVVGIRTVIIMCYSG